VRRSGEFGAKNGGSEPASRTIEGEGGFVLFLLHRPDTSTVEVRTAIETV